MMFLLNLDQCFALKEIIGVVCNTLTLKLLHSSRAFTSSPNKCPWHPQIPFTFKAELISYPEILANLHTVLKLLAELNIHFVYISHLLEL